MKKIQHQHNKKNEIEYFTLIARLFIIKDILNNMKNKRLANKIRGCLWLSPGRIWAGTKMTGEGRNRG